MSKLFANTEMGFVRINGGYVKDPFCFRRNPRLVLITDDRNCAHLFHRLSGKLWAKSFQRDGFDAEFEPVVCVISEEPEDRLL